MGQIALLEDNRKQCENQLRGEMKDDRTEYERKLERVFKILDDTRKDLVHAILNNSSH